MAQEITRFGRMRAPLTNSSAPRSSQAIDKEGSAHKCSPWYRAYCAAMLQLNAGKLFEEIEAAQQAIQDRLAELASGAQDADGESGELQRALNYLLLLLRCSNMEGGQLLWQ
jgi:hypothetical protein